MRGLAKKTFFEERREHFILAYEYASVFICACTNTHTNTHTKKKNFDWSTIPHRLSQLTHAKVALKIKPALKTRSKKTDVMRGLEQ